MVWLLKKRNKHHKNDALVDFIISYRLWSFMFIVLLAFDSGCVMVCAGCGLSLCGVVSCCFWSCYRLKLVAG